jgi:outer membrane protein OmpA-like peptidoglycan-associated protein
LTRNSFTRSGYSFVNWNTSANGSGVRYANGAFYSFSTSTTLYAQWKKNKKIIPPPPPPKITGPVVGPFALRSSTLSPLLESQIQNIADQVKAKGDKQIALLGYGDKLTAAAERNSALSAKNVELGQKRAQAVATYLEGRLAALGLKGWTISIAAAGAAKAGSIQYEIAIVIATLS